VRPRLLASLFGLLAFLTPAAGASGPLKLADGDRVVLVGGTLIEREQRYGYWEWALTAGNPGRKVTFRNLGWSGDTVFGEARGSFGGQPEGYRHLKEQVRALKPTVILLAYGANESFAGRGGLPKFRKGLGALLDAFAPTKPRIVLLAPTRHEDLGGPLPDPSAHNKDLRLYADAVRDAARKRGCPFVDLYDLLGDGAKAKPPAPLTDNGIHLTAWGYWRSAPLLARGLGLPRPRWRVEVDVKERRVRSEGAKAEKLATGPVRFTLTDAMLPPPPPPKDGAPKTPVSLTQRTLRIKGLPPGSYALHVDGKPVAAASAEEWAKGVRLERGPEFDQAEKLRRTIVAKNRLYFHRWRPQNVTYLFGFRKDEQGKNAREVPQFDPLVAAKEAEIAKLRAPVAHTYELKKK
jgi:lysophospholipase L1-like esterase